MTRVDRGALLEAARRHERPGINARIALILGYAELAGCPLDPETFDHAALILRAERLLLEGLQVDEALRTATAEFVTFSAGGGS